VLELRQPNISVAHGVLVLTRPRHPRTRIPIPHGPIRGAHKVGGRLREGGKARRYLGAREGETGGGSGEVRGGKRELVCVAYSSCHRDYGPSVTCWEE
jgi:hypothetical protein